MGRQYLSSLEKSRLFLLLRLRLVLGKKREKSSGLILGESSAELVDRRRNLQSSHEKLSLSLDSVVAGRRWVCVRV
jgi:hypothetical protein